MEDLSCCYGGRKWRNEELLCLWFGGVRTPEERREEGGCCRIFSQQLQPMRGELEGTKVDGNDGGRLADGCWVCSAENEEKKRRECGLGVA